MDADEITFEDLLGEEPADTALPTSLAQLLADGFPRHGGLVELAAIGQLAAADPQCAALRRSYLQLLELQRRAPASCGEARDRTLPALLRSPAIRPEP